MNCAETEKNKRYVLDDNVDELLGTDSSSTHKHF